MNRYQFICLERGCGPCGVKLIDAVYLETRTMDGKLLVSESEPRLVSTCCGAEFEIWDNRTDDTSSYRVTIGTTGGEESKPPVQGSGS